MQSWAIGDYPSLWLAGKLKALICVSAFFDAVADLSATSLANKTIISY
jgi:hypothetical protein